MSVPTLKFKSIANPRVLLRTASPINHVDEVLASLQVESGGTDTATNKFIVTSALPEAEGNLITFAMVSAPTEYITTASAVDLPGNTGGAVTVALAGLSRMVVTGALKVAEAGATVTFPAMYWNLIEALPTWTSVDNKYSVTRDALNTKWVLAYSEDGTNVVASWEATSDVATPNLVPVGAGGWLPVVLETGTPAVAATLPNAEQVQVAVEASQTVEDLMVTFSYPNGQSGIGRVAVYPTTALSRGTAHTRPNHIGQICIVDDGDTVKDAWIAVSISPVTWLKLN